MEKAGLLILSFSVATSSSVIERTRVLVLFCGDLCSFVETCVLVFPKSKIKIIKPILGQTSVFWPWYMETSLPPGFLEKVLD